MINTSAVVRRDGELRKLRTLDLVAILRVGS
jgi:hypothetical protein